MGKERKTSKFGKAAAAIAIVGFVGAIGGVGLAELSGVNNVSGAKSTVERDNHKIAKDEAVIASLPKICGQYISGLEKSAPISSYQAPSIKQNRACSQVSEASLVGALSARDAIYGVESDLISDESRLAYIRQSGNVFEFAKNGFVVGEGVLALCVGFISVFDGIIQSVGDNYSPTA